MTGAILVTGAAGFVGSHLIDLLHPSSERLIGWHRPGGHQPRRTDLEWMAVDILQPTTVCEALASIRPSCIYHCAGASHVGRSWQNTAETLALNVRGTAHLLAAARENVPEARILVPSSAMVYRPSERALTESSPLGPSSPYGLSKLAQETLAIKAGRHDSQSILVARAFNHLGPRQSDSFASSAFARQIATIEAGRAEAVIRVGNLDARRDFTDVRDTVRAYQLLVASAQVAQPYNVCSGRAYAISEILERLLSKARVSITVKTDPTLYRQQDEPILVGDPSRLQAELGWQTTIPLDQTLDDILNYWRARLEHL